MLYFILFVIFIFILTYHIKKSNASQREVEEEFWENERNANNTRRKDISQLNYITIPCDKIPLNIGSTTEEELIALSNEKILNLTGYTNTEIKALYGPSNLEILSEYDANFTKFVHLISEYCKELMEHDQTKDAQFLLEYAISCKADSSGIYSQLAEIYRSNGESDKIEGLLRSAEELNPMSADIIRRKLKDYLP